MRKKTVVIFFHENVLNSPSTNDNDGRYMTIGRKQRPKNMDKCVMIFRTDLPNRISKYWKIIRNLN